MQWASRLRITSVADMTLEEEECDATRKEGHENGIQETLMEDGLDKMEENYNYLIWWDIVKSYL